MNKRMLACGVGLGGLVVSVLATAPASADYGGRPPSTPTDLRIADLFLDQVVLEWTGSTDPDSEKATYEFSIDDGPFYDFSRFHDDYDLTESQPELGSVGDLDQGTHTFEVRAVDAEGNVSGVSDPLSVTMPSPPVPTGVQLVDHSGDSATVAWDEPAPPEVCGDCVTRHAVYIDGQLELTTSDTAAQVRRLSPGEEHRITVTTRYFEDFLPAPAPSLFADPFLARVESPQSAPVSVTNEASADTTSPTAPSNLRRETIFLGNGWLIRLFWDQSTDDVTPQSEIEYDWLVPDPITDGFQVKEYDIAKGTTEHPFETFARALWGAHLRAADDAGNTSELLDLNTADSVDPA